MPRMVAVPSGVEGGMRGRLRGAAGLIEEERWQLRWEESQYGVTMLDRAYATHMCVHWEMGEESKLNQNSKSSFLVFIFWWHRWSGHFQ